MPLKLEQSLIEEFEIVDHLIPQKGSFNIVREGILEKRTRVFSKVRYFILLENGHLNYYSSGKLRGTIELGHDTKVMEKSADRFIMEHGDQTYEFLTK